MRCDPKVLDDGGQRLEPRVVRPVQAEQHVEELLVGRCQHLVAGDRIVAGCVSIEPPEAFDLRMGTDDGEAKPVRIVRRALLPALDECSAV